MCFFRPLSLSPHPLFSRTRYVGLLEWSCILLEKKICNHIRTQLDKARKRRKRKKLYEKSIHPFDLLTRLVIVRENERETQERKTVVYLQSTDVKTLKVNRHPRWVIFKRISWHLNDRLERMWHSQYDFGDIPVSHSGPVRFFGHWHFAFEPTNTHIPPAWQFNEQ